MTKPLSKFQQRLVNYLEKQYPRYIPKGTICDLARAKIGATGEHTGRRLRELENLGRIEVTHIKNHDHYRFMPQQDLVEWFDRLAANSANV